MLTFRLHSLLLISALTAALCGCRLTQDGEIESALAPTEPRPLSSDQEQLLLHNSDEGYRPMASTQGGEYSIIRVFYGTNRRRTGKTDPAGFYDHNRDRVHYGYCDVSIPDNHQEGELERPSLWRFEFREDPNKHIVLKTVSEVPRDEFLGTLREEVSQSQSREAFVFIHGYNVSFASAAQRTAQIAADLRFDGPPIMYSWPSAGAVVGYVADLSAADASQSELQSFMEDVARESGATRIHLVAHSMGNRLLTNVLSQLADDSCQREVPRFNEVILAAPDVDAEVFRSEIAPKILSTADRLTIYASEKDIALEASEEVHRSSRLGQAGRKLTTFPNVVGIDVVDASQVDFSVFTLGHSVYGVELLNDIRLVLAGSRPGDRGLLPNSAGSAWMVQSISPLEPIERGMIIQAKATTTTWWQRSRAVLLSKVATMGGTR